MRLNIGVKRKNPYKPTHSEPASGSFSRSMKATRTSPMPSFRVILACLAALATAFIFISKGGQSTPTPAAKTLTVADGAAEPLIHLDGEPREFRIIGGNVDSLIDRQGATGMVVLFGVRVGEEDRIDNRICLLNWIQGIGTLQKTVWAKQVRIPHKTKTQTLYDVVWVVIKK